MFARITTLQVMPDQVDKVTNIVHSVVFPFAQQQQGCQNVCLLVDRDTGKCLVMSFWKTAAQREATGSTSSYFRTQIEPYTDFLTMTPVVEDYDAILPVAG